MSSDKKDKLTIPQLLDMNASVSDESVKKSKAMYSWKLNENISRIERYLTKWPDKKSSSLYKVIMDEQEFMTERYSKIEQLNMHTYMNTEDGSKEREDCQKEWKTVTERFEKVNADITDAMSGWKENDGHESDVESVSQTTTMAPNIIATDIRPSVISLEFSVAECEKWVEDLRFYFIQCGLTSQNNANQRMFLNPLLDSQIRASLLTKVDKEAGLEACINGIKEIFIEKWPLMSRRWICWELKQKDNEDYFSFRGRLQEAWVQAEMDGVSGVELFNILLVNNLTDKILKSKLSSMEKLETASMGNKAREHGRKSRISEIGKNNDEIAMGNKTSQVRDKKTWRCNKCSRPGHFAKECRTKNMKCDKCNGIDHVTDAWICPKKEKKKKTNWSRQTDVKSDDKHNNEESKSSDDETHSGRGTKHYEKYYSNMTKSSVKMYDIGGIDEDIGIDPNLEVPELTVPGLVSDDEDSDNEELEETIRMTQAEHETPMLDIVMEQDNREWDVKALTDSGSTKGLMSLKLAKKTNLKIDTSRNIRLYNASDKLMRVHGVVQVLMRPKRINGNLNTGKKNMVKTEFIVTSELSGDVFISCHDMKRIGVVSWDFPEVHSECKKTVSTNENEIKKYDDIIMPGLSQNQRKQIEDLLDEFGDIFSDKIDNKKYIGEEVGIELRDDIQIKPTKHLTTRSPPLAYQKAAEIKLQDLISGGIIVEDDSAADWVARGHFVPKKSKNGELRVRLVVDLRGLNAVVKRPTRGFPKISQLRANVKKESRYFMVSDLTDGYHQCKLSEEASKLTTFVVSTGQGARTYRWVRCPQGLVLSGDVFNIASDKAFHGIEDTMKLVDDVFSQSASWEGYMMRLREIFTRARDHHIYISKRKLQFGSTVLFAGFKVEHKDEVGAVLKPDPDLLRDIREFPVPTCAREIKGFQGLVNQVSCFNPDTSQSLVMMRQLLKKNTAFRMTEEMMTEFEDAKIKFGSEEYQTLHPFCENLETGMMFDGSILNGLGWALYQYEKDVSNGIRLIKCGSRSLTPAMRNYSVGEIEACALYHGMIDCDLYIRGRKFRAISDHRPLIATHRKELDEIKNPRIAAIFEKLRIYDFELEYLPGPFNMLADSLSRLPKLKHFSEEEMRRHQEIEEYMANTTDFTEETYDDIALDRFFAAANIDGEYQEIIQFLEDGKCIKEIPKDHHGRRYKDVWNDIGMIVNSKGDKLMIMDGYRIIVPKTLRKFILGRLHQPHAGTTSMYETAIEHYFWIGLYNDIKNIAENCEICRICSPSKRREPIIHENGTDLSKLEPMEMVSADLFHLKGKDYLLIVDRMSSFPCVEKLNSQRPSEIIQKMDSLFMLFGYPKRIRTDGASTFKGPFVRFCKDHDIIHEVSSAYFPESNGLCERNVGKVKSTMKKAMLEKVNIESALYALRNTVLQGTRSSPASLFLKRGIRCHLPVIEKKFDIEDSKRRRESNRKKFSEKYGERKLSKPFEIGDQVRIQHPKTKLWNTKGEIIEKRDNGLSYLICTENGKTKLRNMKFIQLLESQESQSDQNMCELDTQAPQEASPGALPDSPGVAVEPRRSKRLSSK